jgi:hypothetical protein
MPVFMAQGESNQYILKSQFLDGPSPHTNCGQRFVATCLVGYNIICKFTHILTNNIQELTPYTFQFKCNTNIIGKYYLSMLRFDPKSLCPIVSS